MKWHNNLLHLIAKSGAGDQNVSLQQREKMSQLCKNAIAFLQKRFPVAPVMNHEYKFSYGNGNDAF